MDNPAYPPLFSPFLEFPYRSLFSGSSPLSLPPRRATKKSFWGQRVGESPLLNPRSFSVHILGRGNFFGFSLIFRGKNEMRKPHLGFGGFFIISTLLFLLLLGVSVHSQPCGDETAMDALKNSIEEPSSFGWSDSNCCNWSHVFCDSNRVSSILIGNQNLSGSLPPELVNLSAVTRFEVHNNRLTGSFPNLPGTLTTLLAHGNQFTSFPSDFFAHKSALEEIDIDNNPFSTWKIPESIQDATSLAKFSANKANLIGRVPAFFGGGTFPSLTHLHLAMNSLEGEIPETLAGSRIQTLWLNGQQGNIKLSGSISVLQNMSYLGEVWLHGNQFSGSLPDFSNLQGLQNLSLRDNQLTGIVPPSLVNLNSLLIVNLTNNLLQGPAPKFDSEVQVDMSPGSNSFCTDTPGEPCDARVYALLSVALELRYPSIFAKTWKLNDPCKSWTGITCDGTGNITIINFIGRNLNGTISPSFALLTSVKSLFLSNNSLTGVIPPELTTMPNLIELDVFNNNLFGKVPSFLKNVVVRIDGNPDIGKHSSVPSTGEGRKSRTELIVGSVVGSIGGLLLVGTVACFLYSKRQTQRGRGQVSNTAAVSGRGKAFDSPSSVLPGPTNIHIVEAGSTSMSFQVLRSVTNNFGEENVLGRGGFGSVYKGDLNGTQIAVKRMEPGRVTEKGLGEFKAEITVLTSVRHRNLVGLLGYCLDGHERLLVYEYMPQGPLSRHLFDWKEEGLEPLEWTRRLGIALDVARGVEYLHGLAHQSFIHRDLKPSNILLGYDMRAKVADFGLVKLAPEGISSVETRLAGTFGYLAPEYAVTGRVTTKIDVYSFGVILMELITGRKALDGSQPEGSLHLVSWFQRISVEKGLNNTIDPTIGINEETLSSIGRVAELASHCCAREPYRRPDMGHIVNVLSSLVEVWKPAEARPEQATGIDFNVSLKEAVERWQALGGGSNLDEHSFSSSTPFL